MRTSAIRIMFVLLSVAVISTSIAVRGQKSRSGNPLSGTSWQLVRFQGSDDTTFAPDDKSKYTIKFGSNGRVTARVDCNRASSSWRVTANNQLEFGSWSRTTAKCGPGSLHDRIVSEGAAVRNFVIKDGHLFLSGGGGSYELEPISGGKQ